MKALVFFLLLSSIALADFVSIGKVESSFSGISCDKYTGSPLCQCCVSPFSYGAFSFPRGSRFDGAVFVESNFSSYGYGRVNISFEAANGTYSIFIPKRKANFPLYANITLDGMNYTPNRDITFHENDTLVPLTEKPTYLLKGAHWIGINFTNLYFGETEGIWEHNFIFSQLVMAKTERESSAPEIQNITFGKEVTIGTEQKFIFRISDNVGASKAEVFVGNDSYPASLVSGTPWDGWFSTVYTPKTLNVRFFYIKVTDEEKNIVKSPSFYFSVLEDRLPPTVSVTYEKDLFLIGNRTTAYIDVSAKDNVGMDSVLIGINGTFSKMEKDGSVWKRQVVMETNGSTEFFIRPFDINNNSKDYGPYIINAHEISQAPPISYGFFNTTSEFSGEVEFRVPKSWLSENNLTENDISIGGFWPWKSYKPTKGKETADYIYYKANVSSAGTLFVYAGEFSFSSNLTAPTVNVVRRVDGLVEGLLIGIGVGLLLAFLLSWLASFQI
ncbi:MAG: hypothetical protein HZB68_03015 [Candidatus Aenigmarchaeota archaeon]|nr:hypothetical protein [Candidatus Aenigmarchaeota archaeon]